MPADRPLWTPKPGGLIGKPIRRFEDSRLLRGEGQYIADLHIDGITHMAVVRAIYPHARILGIDTDDAASLPGVLGVWTGSDTAAGGLGGLPWERRPFNVPTDLPKGDPAIGQPQPVLARDHVQYLGQPVAVVVAETREQALDSAEAVIVDYEPLAPLMDVREAAQPGAHQLWTQSPGNCCFEFQVGDAAATEAAISAAPTVVRLS
ncbi:MAG: xanthine dehydrogenase family protein molybdopterin-binding subunit, partial [Pseudomonadota bacterium]|nr:xanthine dehydrogenase family protein molybdopterin-binding subunit [Pseudomonadota bacterium]